MSYLFSVFKALLLILLAAIPYMVYLWTRANRPRQIGLFTGVTLGLVVSPVSSGLYLLGFLLPLIGLIPALVGGMLAMFHGVPGYQLSIFLGIQEPGVVVEGYYAEIWIQALSAVFWGVTYGIVGLILDKTLIRHGSA
jgi:hypothetical protein